MAKVVTIGEPMIMFVAQMEGPLKDVAAYDRFIAGAEINVSIGVKRLGHDMTYITQVGNDPFGAYIKEFIAAEKINTDQVFTSETFPTGFQLKAKDQENDPEVVYFRKGSAASHLGDAPTPTIDFSEVDLLHVTGIFMALNENTYAYVKQLIADAKQAGALVTFDPNLRPTLWPDEATMVARINEMAALADYVLPGLSEGQRLTGKETKEEIADFYLGQGSQGVIIKLGPAGAYVKVKTAAGLVEEVIPGFKLKEVVDTVGAGDGFAVGVITGLLEGLEWPAILKRANAIGAIQVSHISDNENLPTPQRLAEFIAAYEGSGE